MATATARAGISVVKGTDGSGVNYRTPKPSFSFSISGSNGPTPGSILIATSGTDISFAQLSEYGGYCEITHLGNDETNFVTYGIFDGSRFYPFGEIKAGQTSTFFLSRFFPGEFGTTGTGTLNTDANTLRMYAWSAPVRVFIGAFDP